MQLIVKALPVFLPDQRTALVVHFEAFGRAAFALRITDGAGFPPDGNTIEQLQLMVEVSLYLA